MGASWRLRLAAGSVFGVAALVAACLVAPATSVAADTVTQTFALTGALQQFTVPAGICGVTITGTGGSGGGLVASYSGSGGVGARVSAHLSVTPGTQLHVLVGQSGGSGIIDPSSTGGPGGFGGGGGGSLQGGGGGGVSAVFDAEGPLLVAGGGGGGGALVDSPIRGGDAGLLGADAATGSAPNGPYHGGTGGTVAGDGGTGPEYYYYQDNPFSAGGGGGVGLGGTSVAGGVGGRGSNGYGGGGGALSSLADKRPGDAASPTETGTGGAGDHYYDTPGGNGGQGTSGGGKGASADDLSMGGGGGGGGGAGFGGGGGGYGQGAGGGGAGFGAGGGGVYGGGGGGSSWVTPSATGASSALATSQGNGRVVIRYDSYGDLCTVVLPGNGTVTAPSTGTADLAVSVTLSAPSALPVIVTWKTLNVPNAPVTAYLGPQAPTTDYMPSSGTITFAPGQTAADVHIPVLHCSTPVGVEYIVVSFLAQANARNGGFWGLGFGIVLAEP